MAKKIFLLGGYDLEMLTIKDLLQQLGETYFDKQLEWGARLTDYKSELDKYGNKDEFTIYGIELNESGYSPIPSNYQRIDHHNDYSHKSSAIEQVCELLDRKMTDHQKLVAANDALYIDGMIALGADQKTIDEIRSLDRAAQGVTEKDEKLAIEAINNKKEKGGLTTVYSKTSKFSPICDRLYPCVNLLIYTDNELTYYGKYKEKVKEILYSLTTNISDLEPYEGGGKEGFVGIPADALNKANVLEIVEQISNACVLRSYHIFYYPFRWSLENGKDSAFSPSKDLQGIVNQNPNVWKRANDLPNDSESEELYNEKNYFYPFVHSILYDNQSDNPYNLIKHFKREEPQNETVTFQFEVKLDDKGNAKVYKLDVDAINLNFYATGVGILSFYLENKDANQAKEEDILRINQFGRRIFPPYYEDIEKRFEIANWIKIEGLEGDATRYYEDFEAYKKIDFWKPANHIKSLIKDLSTCLVTQPIVDDRMFVNCWYANNDLSKKVANKEKPWLRKKTNLDKFLYEEDFWYKYIYVDGDGLTCQNKDMLKQKIKSQIYLRWQKYGTIYGITRYSMVALTDEGDFAYNILAKHMRSMYSRMWELVIVQRSSILLFSNEIKNVSASLTDKASMGKNKDATISCASSLYKEYIQFINQVYFREITAQDQGLELYGLMKQTLDIDNNVKDLDNEVEELHSLCDIEQNRLVNYSVYLLTQFALWFAVASILVGIISAVMGAVVSEHFFAHLLWIGILFALGIILWFAVVYWLKKYIGKKNK